jgi:hypothetical protein
MTLWERLAGKRNREREGISPRCAGTLKRKFSNEKLPSASVFPFFPWSPAASSFFGDGSGRRWLKSVEEREEGWSRPGRFVTTIVDGGSHHDMAHDGQFRTYDTRTRNEGRQKNTASHRMACMYVMVLFTPMMPERIL